MNVAASPIADTGKVLIINIDEQLPEGVKLVGNIKVADGGFKTRCSYERTIEEAKEKARNNGRVQRDAMK
jgi:hypothetical protein